MARKIKSRVTDELSSSFTSMIDIVFLLLIFFILQPFKETELKLGASLPQSGAPKENSEVTPKVDIKVLVRAVPGNPNSAMYVIDGRPVGMASGPVYRRLPSVLVQRSNGDKDAPISILPSGEVNFQHVLRVLDACYRAKMPNVKFGMGG